MDKPHYGARVVSRYFKTLSWIVLIGAPVSAIATGVLMHKAGASGGAILVAVLGVLGGALLTAACLGFFAFVLELLVDIELNTARSAPVAEMISHSNDGQSPPGRSIINPKDDKHPAGWYRDPHEVARERFWNGYEWTSAVRS